MKRMCLLVILLALFMTGHAQDKKIDFPFRPGESLMDNIQLGENGFIIKTSQRILFLSFMCDLVWEIDIEENYTRGDHITVASGDGSVVYNVNAKLDAFLRRPHFITQIARDGSKRKFTVEPDKNFGKEVINVFCDTDFLYYLALGDSQDGKNKNTLILNRFKKEDLSHERIDLNVPKRKDDYWYYLGQFNGVKYIANKSLEIRDEENVIQVSGFNSNGKVVESTTLTYSLQGKFSRPALNIDAPRRGWIIMRDNDFMLKSVKISSPAPKIITYNSEYLEFGTGPRTVMSYGMTTETTSSILVHQEGAFVHISMDERDGSFYVYSLLGSKPFNKSGIGNVYEGFYIFKFGNDGDNKWKLLYSSAPELEEEKYFRVHGMPADRHINLVFLPDQDLSFTLKFKRNLVTYSISSEGKLTGKDKVEEGFSWLPGGIPTGNYVKSGRLVPTHNLMKSKSFKFYTNYFSSKGEVLQEVDSDTGLTFSYFKP